MQFHEIAEIKGYSISIGQAGARRNQTSQPHQEAKEEKK